MCALPTDSSTTPFDLVVAGGGAAGFFGAITFAEARPGSRVLILEKTSHVLGKVKISGGGRCNVTHACFDPRTLTQFYPRGSKQLIGPFNHWSPADTMTWFENRGVPLKIESDGRVFPQSDSSQTIIDCLLSTARSAGVIVRTHTALDTATTLPDTTFQLHLTPYETLTTRRLLLTLGGTRNPIGAHLAASFGHRIEDAAHPFSPSKSPTPAYPTSPDSPSPTPPSRSSPPTPNSASRPPAPSSSPTGA